MTRAPPRHISPSRDASSHAMRAAHATRDVNLDELKSTFDARGYVVVEDYLDECAVSALRDEFERVFRCDRDHRARRDVVTDAVCSLRLGGSEVCDVDRWSALERAGCVVQVNQLATADGFDPNFDHRRAASTSGEPTFLRAEVSRLVCGDGAIGIVAAALLGSSDTRLFNDQYIVKPPHRHGRALDSSCFQWHYDSQWCDGDCKANYRQYLSAWVALDDVSEDNGTLRMLPYAPSGDGGTHRARAANYPGINTLASPLDDGDLDGRPLTMKAGSVAFFSDVVLHCSGPNLADVERRAWMPQFSDGPVFREDGKAVSLTIRLE